LDTASLERPEFTNHDYALGRLVIRLMHHQPHYLERGNDAEEMIPSTTDGKGHRSRKDAAKRAGKNNDSGQNFDPSETIACDAP